MLQNLPKNLDLLFFLELLDFFPVKVMKSILFSFANSAPLRIFGDSPLTLIKKTKSFLSQ